MRNKPRKKHHVNVGRLPRADALRVARRRALSLAKELNYNLEPPQQWPATPAPDDRHPNRWIADTGSGEDLVHPEDVPECSLKQPIETDDPTTLLTANGSIKVGKRVNLRCIALEEHITPLLLPDTPAVLSVGKRVVELLYDPASRSHVNDYQRGRTPPIKMANLMLRGIA